MRVGDRQRSLNYDSQELSVQANSDTDPETTAEFKWLLWEVNGTPGVSGRCNLEERGQ